MTRHIRIRQFYGKRSTPVYFLFVFGHVYAFDVPERDMPKWIKYALARVKGRLLPDGSHPPPEPLSGVRACE